MSRDKIYGEKKETYVSEVNHYYLDTLKMNFVPEHIVTSTSPQLKMNETTFTLRADDEVNMIADGIYATSYSGGVIIESTDTNGEITIRSSYNGGSDLAFMNFSESSGIKIEENMSQGIRLDSNSEVKLTTGDAYLHISGDQVDIMADGELSIVTDRVNFPQAVRKYYDGDLTIETNGNSVFFSDNELVVDPPSSGFLFTGDLSVIAEEDNDIELNTTGNGFIKASSGENYLKINSDEDGVEIFSPDGGIVLTSDDSVHGDSVVSIRAGAEDGNYFLECLNVSGSTSYGGLLKQPSGTEAFRADDGGGLDGAVNFSDTGTSLETEGGLVFISLGADFAEFIKVRDDDFPEYKNKEGEVMLPEGLVVYCRENECRREGPGIPMAVSRSSLILGNAKEGLNHSFSFTGQIKVLVKGSVSSGDLLVPSGSFCIAKPTSAVTMEEYINSIGRASESSDVEDVKRINCFIGKK